MEWDGDEVMVLKYKKCNVLKWDSMSDDLCHNCDIIHLIFLIFLIHNHILKLT